MNILSAATLGDKPHYLGLSLYEIVLAESIRSFIPHTAFILINLEKWLQLLFSHPYISYFTYHLCPQGCCFSFPFSCKIFYFFIPLLISNAFVPTVECGAEFALVLWKLLKVSQFVYYQMEHHASDHSFYYEDWD